MVMMTMTMITATMKPPFGKGSLNSPPEVVFRRLSSLWKGGIGIVISGIVMTPATAIIMSSSASSLLKPSSSPCSPPFHQSPPFAEQVTNWLTEQKQPFELFRIDHENDTQPPSGTITATTTFKKGTSSYMIHLPTTSSNGDENAKFDRVTTVLGLHLVPTPTCEEECLKPRTILDMTKTHHLPGTMTSCVDATDFSTLNSIPSKHGHHDVQRIEEGPEHYQSPTRYAYTKIIHLHQDVWEAKLDIVQSRLLMQRHQQDRIMARQTIVRKIPSNVAMEFLQHHHLWGSTKAKHSYGLYRRVRISPKNPTHQLETEEKKRKRNKDDETEELVAVATFSNRRKIHRCDRIFQSYELLRFCSQKDTTVVGGISKLIKAFIRDKKPDDIVTVVDRDWGDGSGWHSVGFTTVATMDPIVMVVNPNEPGVRRHLVGAGIDASGTTRMGLPQEIRDELDSVDTAEEARTILARYNFFVVYDAGVERLFRIVEDSPGDTVVTSTNTNTYTVSSTNTPIKVWHSSLPKYAEKYYSPNRGIMALLREAAGETHQLPEDTGSKETRNEDRQSGVDWVSSWQSTSGSAASAKLIISAPSSLNSNATVEIRERSHGWRTVGLIGGSTKSIYHAVYKVDPETGMVEPEAVVSDYITVMAESFLAAVKYQRETGLRVDDESKRFRLLHLGFGGGTLLRLLAHRLVGCNQKAVELDEGVVAVSSSSMIPNVEVCVGDASKIQLGANEQAWDGIFIDIFDEYNQLPSIFYSMEYLRHLRDTLVVPEKGIVVLNLHSGGKKRQSQIDEAHQSFLQVFPFVRVISARDSKPNGGNVVITGSATELPNEMELKRMMDRSDLLPSRV